MGANPAQNKGERPTIGGGFWENVTNRKAASRRCVNTVDPGGLADYQGVD